MPPDTKPHYVCGSGMCGDPLGYVLGAAKRCPRHPSAVPVWAVPMTVAPRKRNTRRRRAPSEKYAGCPDGCGNDCCIRDADAT